jgi:hypothetical protein
MLHVFLQQDEIIYFFREYVELDTSLFEWVKPLDPINISKCRKQI